ncbi:MAG: tetratricopeptide repeat protein [Deltaproteobacteria bacterium]|nr:tetratricopeptide repeat protein [Deltaproteobacteria bacterium]
MKTPRENYHPIRRRYCGPVSVVVLQTFLAAAVLGPVLSYTNAAEAAKKRIDKREIEARQAFAAGRYQEALDLYAELYADKVHPTYLRNVGRCYQNLKQPDKAINAFRDYLRQAKKLTASERTEVEGYIAEMEALEKQQEEEAAAAQAAAAQKAAAEQAAAQQEAERAAAAQAAARAQAAQLTSRPAEPLAPEPTPLYKKGWFWGVVGVVVVAGVVGGLYAGGVFSDSSIACTAASGCF